MELAAALGWLESYVNLEGNKKPSGSSRSLPTAGQTEGLGIDAMLELLGAIGDPQKSFRSVHLTGTNGKGSTNAYVTALLRASGLSVGSYTSPNLERINERIAYDGSPIPDVDLAQVLTLLSEVVPLLTHTPSRFELLTAAAFAWFAELGVEVAVVEVGLLGRFDATNVLDAEVVVLTNIGKDHTDGAPGWREQVVFEKAGIITPNAHVILGEQLDELRRFVEAENPREISEAGTDFEVEANEIALGGRAIDLRTSFGTYDTVFLPVHGRHQGDNFATAVAATEAFFGRKLDDELVEMAMADIELPGRFEVVKREPTIILDGAHNPEGALVTKETLDTEFARLGSWVLVFGMLNGKEPAELLDSIGAADFDAVIICEPTWSRAIPAERVAYAAGQMGIQAEIVKSPIEALRRAKAVTAGEDLILVTGSFYVVGEVRAAARSVVDD